MSGAAVGQSRSDVLTGIIGRFIYGLIPSAGGKAMEISDVLGRWERLRARVQPMLDDADNPALLHRLFDSAGVGVAMAKASAVYND